MGRFSVDRSMNVGGQPPSPTMPQTQPYGQQNYGSPYGQQMPQQQGMMMQQQQAEAPAEPTPDQPANPLLANDQNSNA